jgi:hydroxyethylthiazole kinase-like uncharacterized protein yjeF
MKHGYTAAEIRAAEQPLLDDLPPGTLMQRAAFALARRCAQLLGRVYGAHVVLLVGAGNNGADALYAGATLARRGARVAALRVSERVEEEAAAAFRAAGGVFAQLEDDGALDEADLVVDAMVGIGANRPLRPSMARLARRLQEGTALVVAADIPSGVDPSTGEVPGEAVRADVTVTFGAWKVGLLVAPGASYAGTVEVVDIGLTLPPAPVRSWDLSDVAACLPRPQHETDKYRRGVLGVVAGSDRYTGAAVLAVGGALAAGVGMVRYLGPAAAAAQVRARWPESVVTVAETGDVEALERLGRVQAWVAGPGLGTDEHAQRIVAGLCAREEPLLLDADALTIVATDLDLLRRRSAPTVLTPHAGEFARLAGSDADNVAAHRLLAVRPVAQALGATVVLKGSSTLIASPDGTVDVNTVQTPELATAGSGDVLSGIVGAFLAGGLPAGTAAAAGAAVHGLAGTIAAGDPGHPIVASDIVAAVPHAISTILA